MVPSTYQHAYRLDPRFIVDVDAEPLEFSNISAGSSSTWQNFKDKSVECLSAISSFAIRVGSAFLRALQSFLQIMINPFVDDTVYNRAQALEMVRNQGSALCRCSDALKDDKEVVLAALQNQPLALSCVSSRLQNDREVILAALRGHLPTHGSLLYLASEQLRGDREVVGAAVRQGGSSLAFASRDLWGDRELVLEALQTAPWLFSRISEALRADREVVRLAVRADKSLLRFASAELRSDPEFIAIGNH